jgi:hypothetical protein
MLADRPSSLASQLLQKSKKQKAKSKSRAHPPLFTTQQAER